MEAAILGIIDKIGGQGTGYLLFCLAVLAIGWLVLESRRDHKANADKLEAIAAERLKEAKGDVAELLASANVTSTSNATLAAALAANTAAISKVSEALADVLKDNEHGREIWQLTLKSLMDGQVEIKRLISLISETRGSK